MTHTSTTLRSMARAALLATLAVTPTLRAQQPTPTSTLPGQRLQTRIAHARTVQGPVGQGPAAQGRAAQGPAEQGSVAQGPPTSSVPAQSAQAAPVPPVSAKWPEPAPVSAPSPPVALNFPSDPTCADLPRIVTEIARIRPRLDDWAQLARFREANLELPPAASGQPRVVFLGDSITDAWDDPRYGGFFPGKGYVNRGISGQTTPQMVLRMRADVLAHEPKALVLLAGTNDIAGNTGPMTVTQTQDNITTIAELATLHGIKVVLASILPTSNYHFTGDSPLGPQTVRRPLAKIRAINDWMRAYAKAHGHTYLDYFSATVDAQGMLKKELSADDLHPNAAGYAVMGPLAEAAIARALGGR